MSLETALTRVAELNAVFTAAPAARPIASPAGAAGASFADILAREASPGPTPAAPAAYTHLSGDLDADPELLRRLEQLAGERGEPWHVTSGLRERAEQQRLWDARGSNPFPVARPGTSLHESGRAADVTIGGRPIQDVVPAADLRRAGLVPLAGDAVHVELAR